LNFTNNPQAARQFNHALQTHQVVRVVCKTNDILCEPWLRKLHPEFIALDIGLKLNPPIFDLVVDEEGIKGTLQFGPRRSYVTIFWYAVVQVIDPMAAPAPPKRPALRVIKGGKA
jgi:hypothetical protein